jgi:hypothetical protein
VLFGPPGTGKSQSITHCPAHRKTVLFFSQKTAAVEVVRQRMNTVGFSNYCLDVHSTEAQMSSVLEQLDRMTVATGTAFNLSSPQEVLTAENVSLRLLLA